MESERRPTATGRQPQAKNPQVRIIDELNSNPIQTNDYNTMSEFDPIAVQAFQKVYAKNFEHQAQQKMKRLAQMARQKLGCIGASETHNSLEEEDMTETTGQRMALTQLSEVKGEIRHVFPRKFLSAKGQDQFDKVLMGSTVLPGSDIMVAQTSAYNRKCDDVFVDGITGVNSVGVNGATQETLHADLIIPVDYVRTGSDTASNLTTGKIRYIKRQFEKNEFYGQDQKAAGAKLCAAINADMKDAILDDPLVSDADKSRINKLDDGDLVYWMGTWFIRTERLPVDASNANVVNAVFWVSNMVQFNEWAHSVKRISERSDRSYAIQYYIEKMNGACRLEQKAVATAACQTDLFPA